MNTRFTPTPIGIAHALWKSSQSLPLSSSETHNSKSHGFKHALIRSESGARRTRRGIKAVFGGEVAGGGNTSKGIKKWIYKSSPRNDHMHLQNARNSVFFISVGENRVITTFVNRVLLRCFRAANSCSGYAAYHPAIAWPLCDTSFTIPAFTTRKLSGGIQKAWQLQLPHTRIGSFLQSSGMKWSLTF